MLFSDMLVEIVLSWITKTFGATDLIGTDVQILFVLMRQLMSLEIGFQTEGFWFARCRAYLAAKDVRMLAGFVTPDAVSLHLAVERWFYLPELMRMPE